MNRKQSHGALIVMLAPAGTHVKPFCTAFVAALRKRYHTVRAFSGAEPRDPARHVVPGIESALRSMAFIEAAVAASASDVKWHEFPRLD